MNYDTLKVTLEGGIAHVAFNRPQKLNALHEQGWQELQDVFEALDKTAEARVIVLSGEGKHFCAGIDLSMLMGTMQRLNIECEGRKRELLRQFIIRLQNTINAIEKCRKPVLAAIQRGCIGGGVDIISACDMRYCTEDAFFVIKEVDMGLVADLGTMQRLPKLIGQGITRELAYTGRNLVAAEAEKVGLVNRVFADKEAMLAGVMDIARTIASKSPLVIRGTKEILNYSRDHTVADGLNYMSVWNAAMLLSNDLNESFQAVMEKREAKFKD